MKNHIISYPKAGDNLVDDLLGAFAGRQVVLEGVGNGRWSNNVDVSVNKGGDRFAIMRDLFKRLNFIKRLNFSGINVDISTFSKASKVFVKIIR